jgi:ubiquinone/menaquinone biosynthesis C-methylase UbiE
MRLRVQEVNVDSPAAVPQRAWLLRVYLWACERLYAELAWAYDIVSWIVSAGQWRRWQTSAWSYIHGPHVLELGCGTGAMLIEGQRLGYKIIGVDRSPAMVKVALQRMEISQSVAPVIVGDGHSLPMPGGAFDSVLATFPAGYILEEETLSEIRRVLRAGGRVVIVGLWVEVNLGGLERILPFFYGRPGPQTLALIADRFGAAGFAVQWKEVPSGRFMLGVLVAERER